MAKKRMFSLGVLDTDAFLDMPLSAQALYFHLNLRADDDGFVGNPKRVTQNVGASIDDLKLLVAKRFVIAFEDGVIVIKHWRMHNAIKSDRYIKTNYIEDLAMLDIKDNGAYTLSDGGAQMEHKRSTNGAQMSQTSSVGLGIGLGKDSIDANNTITASRFAPPTPTDVENYATEKGLTIDADKFCDFYESKGWMVGKNKMKDWKAAVRGWCSRDKTNGTIQRSGKVQASQGFSTERADCVDYNALAWERARQAWAEDEGGDE